MSNNIGRKAMEATQRNVTGRACYSIKEFCAAHTISLAMFYKLRASGKAPRTMSVGTRSLISFEAAAEWRRACESEAA
jgi:hypothetical protein